MLKQIIIKIANSLGVDIYQKPGKFYKNFLKILSKNQIDCVIDVGANVGQYSLKLRKYGYQGDIYSFEPIITTFNLLEENSKQDNKWHIQNFALGANNGQESINISQNTESSSIFNINEIHTQNAPKAKYIGKETITIKKLDDIFPEICSNKKGIFLKIDTQGYEMEVLKGAEKSLEKITGLQIEMSLIKLYENEILFDEIISYLKSRKFNLCQIETGIVDNNTGNLLQFDGIFLKQ